LRPEENVLNGRGVRDAHPDHFRAPRRIGRRSRAACSFYFFVGGTAPDRDFMTCLDQIGRHWPSHNSQAQKGNTHPESLLNDKVMNQQRLEPTTATGVKAIPHESLRSDLVTRLAAEDSRARVSSF
jgi:hypothetical protein